MKNITLCTVACNGLDAVSLMWESYLKYHDRPIFFAYDNNSSDGTREYLEKNADFLYKSDRNAYHGLGLDHLCNKVETEYVLVVDTDIEFLQSTVPMMMSHNAFAVHQKRYSKEWSFISINNTKLNCCPTFMIYATLFRSAELKKILEFFSFTGYRNDERTKFWDTSGMVYNAACLLGHKIVEVELNSYINHYWSVTLNTQWLANDPDRLQRGLESLKVIRSRLLKLRGIPDSSRILMN